MEELKGKTKSGFEFTIQKDISDDMELFELLVEADEGKASVLPKILTRILGPEQKKLLYDHCREESGRVRMTVVSEELAQIFQAVNSLKK